MRIKSDLRVGMTFQECDVQRNYWKGLVKSGKCIINPNSPSPSPPKPSGGGYVNGAWYPNRSGYC